MTLAPFQTVRRAWRAWEEIGASPYALRQIRFGAALPWLKPPSSIPRRFANAYKMTPENQSFADTEMDRMCGRGFVREISFEEARAQHIVSAGFVINGAKDRVVVNYAPFINPHLAAPRFRMETLLDLAPQLQAGDSLFKVDLSDGYYHVGLRAQDQPYLAFRIGRRFFIPLCLNCGLAPAAFIFTKFLRPMVAQLRSLGHRVIAYLDDIGGAPRVAMSQHRGASAADVSVARGEIFQLATRLGVQLHPSKNDFTGAKSLELLGILVDTEAGLYLLSPAKLSKIRSAALALQRVSRARRRFVSLKHLRSFAGLAQCAHLAVTDARLHLRAIWDDVAEANRRGQRDAKLSHQSCRDLLWWIRLRDNPGIGRAIWAPSVGNSRFLHSDANATGWGAVFAGSVPARGLFSPRETTLHINEKELLAVIFGVLAFAKRLRPGEHITQWVDSSVAAANIYNWTSRSPIALALLRILRRLLESLGLSMSTQRLASVLNLLSDRLSRVRPADDWRLTDAAAHSILTHTGPVRVHHFAVRLSAIAKRYTSRIADPFAENLAFHAQWCPRDLLTHI